MVLGSFYLFIYHSPFEAVPARYREFIFSSIVVALVFIIDQVEKSDLFEKSFSKPASWKEEWKGAWKKWGIIIALSIAAMLIANMLGIARPDVHQLDPVKGHPLVLLIM